MKKKTVKSKQKTAPLTIVAAPVVAGLNKLDIVFATHKNNVLNMYCTAGYPHLHSTPAVMLALQESGANIIELGVPYSDPIADGEVIQQSNMRALQNGISIASIFEQLHAVKKELVIPVVLMGYLNPVMQYGLEQFCKDASAAGVSGIILPDLPMQEFETIYQPLFQKYGLYFIFLISPKTSEARIRQADRLSQGFLYAVSSSATTGGDTNFDSQEAYFKKIKNMKLKNPVLIGFGIRDKASFDKANKYAAGGIIGSAYIKALEHADNIAATTAEFIRGIKTL